MKKSPYNGRMLWVIEANYASGKKWAWHAEPLHVYHGAEIAKVNIAYLLKARTKSSTRYRIKIYEPSKK